MKFRKSAIIVACIMVFSTILLVGCGSKNNYVGYWAEDEGWLDGGREITINKDGTFKGRMKDPSCGDEWGTWEKSDNGILLTYDEYDWTVEAYIDEKGFLRMLSCYEGEVDDEEEVYRRIEQ